MYHWNYHPSSATTNTKTITSRSANIKRKMNSTKPHRALTQIVMHKESKGLDQGFDSTNDLFSKIAADINSKGFSINPSALSLALSNQLVEHLNSIEATKFGPSRIDRGHNHMRNNFVRAGKIL